MSWLFKRGRIRALKSEIPNELRIVNAQLEAEKLVSANKDKIINILTEHRDVLLRNIRDLRIESSCLRKERDVLASRIMRLEEDNAKLRRHLSETGGRT